MLPFDVPPSASTDNDIQAVLEAVRTLDPTGERTATVLRNTIDQLLDGEHTGRYDWNTLSKTERAHAGSLVEINIQREFGFPDGDATDFRIAGVQVDCKYSQRFGSWMIPPEALGHLCLLLWADDHRSLWSAGVARITTDLLNESRNRDNKATIKAECRTSIHWLWKDAMLPENALLHMRPADRERVFAEKSGQTRINELFRRAQGRCISRNVVRTVAQQKDYMKRVRGNGGARSTLQEEGILIMGDYSSHRDVAAALCIAVPKEGEFVSVRVTEASEQHEGLPYVILDDRRWVCATPEDPIHRAPLLPTHRR